MLCLEPVQAKVDGESQESPTGLCSHTTSTQWCLFA